MGSSSSLTIQQLAGLSLLVYDNEDDKKILGNIPNEWGARFKKEVDGNWITTALRKLALESAANEIQAVPGVPSDAITIASEVKREITEQYEMNISDTGLRAVLYVSGSKKMSVLAIRGTDLSLFGNIKEDVAIFAGKELDTRIEKVFATQDQYFSSGMMKAYSEVKKFYYGLSKSDSLQKNYPMKAVTGHSLGGMLAKMIAPITGLPTITFNSPGVMEFLKNNNLKTSLCENQIIRTYCAQGDPIGNFHHDNDVKKNNHIFLPIPKGGKIPENLDRLKNINYLLYCLYFRTQNHSMNKLYEFISNEIEYNSLEIT